MIIRSHYLVFSSIFFLLLISISGFFLYQQETVSSLGKAIEYQYPKSMVPIILSEAMVFPLTEINNTHVKNKVEHNRYDSSKRNYISLASMHQILNEPISFNYDDEDKRYIINIGERSFQYIVGTDIGQEGNRFFSMRGGVIKDKENTNAILVSEDMLNFGLGYHVTNVTINSGQKHIYITDIETAMTGSSDYATNFLREWDYDKRLSHLQNLRNPIEGSYVSTRHSQWPGAPRSYRNGYHEGLDFYTHTAGVLIDKNTPVLSMDEGIVIRSDFNYSELTEEYRKEILDIAMSRSITPEYILDMLRGKSVWIQHPNDVVARYVHLDSIESGIDVGTHVTQGQVLGRAGNTGTSQGLEESNEGVHLHLDILIHGQLFWEGLSTEEIVLLMQTIFND